MSIRINGLSQWMFNTLEKAAISNPKSARLFAIPFLPYAFFLKAISPFISIYSNIQDIIAINRESLNDDLNDDLNDYLNVDLNDDDKRFCIETIKKEFKISLIKSIGCAIIFPLYALVSAIIFIAQIIVNPFSAARTNHPVHIALFKDLSCIDRSLRKLITKKHEHNQDELQKELQKIQKERSYLQEHIASLSLQEIQSISDSFDRSDIPFSTLQSVICHLFHL